MHVHQLPSVYKIQACSSDRQSKAYVLEGDIIFPCVGVVLCVCIFATRTCKLDTVGMQNMLRRPLANTTTALAVSTDELAGMGERSVIAHQSRPNVTHPFKFIRQATSKALPPLRRCLQGHTLYTHTHTNVQPHTHTHTHTTYP
jgi:hypothetical protein